MNYKIYRRKKRLKGKVKFSKELPYNFNPAYRKRDDIIDVSKLNIYNKMMINNVLMQKYIRKYKSLLKMVYLLFNDAFPDDSGYPAVLGEVDKLRGLLLDKYHKYLEIEKEKKFLKELEYIETEIKKKYIEDKLYRYELSPNNIIR